MEEIEAAEAKAAQEAEDKRIEEENAKIAADK
jgi:hypothetical protein